MAEEQVEGIEVIHEMAEEQVEGIAVVHEMAEEQVEGIEVVHKMAEEQVEGIEVVRKMAEEQVEGIEVETESSVVPTEVYIMTDDHSEPRTVTIRNQQEIGSELYIISQEEGDEPHVLISLDPGQAIAMQDHNMEADPNEVYTEIEIDNSEEGAYTIETIESILQATERVHQDTGATSGEFMIGTEVSADDPNLMSITEAIDSQAESKSNVMLVTQDVHYEPGPDASATVATHSEHTTEAVKPAIYKIALPAPAPVKREAVDTAPHSTIQLQNMGYRTRFMCDICEKTYTTKSALTEHYRVHTGEKVECPECGKILSDKSAMVKHRQLHSGRTFPCPICNKEFRQSMARNKHMKIHGEKSFKCDECEKTFVSVHSMRKHHRSAHTDERPYPCKYCPKKFKQLDTRKRHQMRHTDERPHVCHLCEKRFIQKTALRGHLLRHEGISFPCDKCGKSYSSKQNLRLHHKKGRGCYPLITNLDPSEISPDLNDTAACEEEEKDEESESDSGVKSEAESYTDEDLKPFKCPRCGKRFPLLKTWRYHTETSRHCGAKWTEGPFKCEYCEKEFSDKMVWTKHVAEGECMGEDDEERKKPFLCKRCGRRFETITGWQLHKNQKKKCKRGHPNSRYESMVLVDPEHQDPMQQKRQPSNPLFECELCGKRFVSANSLKIHQASKKKCFVLDIVAPVDELSEEAPPDSTTCPVCQKTYKTRRIMESHMQVHRLTDRHRCDTCERVFTTASNLKFHIESVHRGIRYKCKECDRVFTTYQWLKSHMQLHSGLKFHCKYCVKRFQNKHMLRDHMRVHTGEKPHKCLYCDEKFISRHQLLSHMRKMHGDIHSKEIEDLIPKASLPGEKRATPNIVASVDGTLRTSVLENIPPAPKEEPKKRKRRSVSRKPKTDADDVNLEEELVENDEPTPAPEDDIDLEMSFSCEDPVMVETEKSDAEEGESQVPSSTKPAAKPTVVKTPKKSATASKDSKERSTKSAKTPRHYVSASSDSDTPRRLSSRSVRMPKKYAEDYVLDPVMVKEEPTDDDSYDECESVASDISTASPSKKRAAHRSENKAKSPVSKPHKKIVTGNEPSPAKSGVESGVKAKHPVGKSRTSGATDSRRPRSVGQSPARGKSIDTAKHSLGDAVNLRPVVMLSRLEMEASSLTVPVSSEESAETDQHSVGRRKRATRSAMLSDSGDVEEEAVSSSGQTPGQIMYSLRQSHNKSLADQETGDQAGASKTRRSRGSKRTLSPEVPQDLLAGGDSQVTTPKKKHCPQFQLVMKTENSTNVSPDDPVVVEVDYVLTGKKKKRRRDDKHSSPPEKAYPSTPAPTRAASQDHPPPNDDDDADVVVTSARKGRQTRSSGAQPESPTLPVRQSTVSKGRDRSRKDDRVHDDDENNDSSAVCNITGEHDYGKMTVLPSEIKVEMSDDEDLSQNISSPTLSPAVGSLNTDGSIAIPLSLTVQNNAIVANPQSGQGSVASPQQTQLSITMIDGVPTLIVNPSNLDMISNMVNAQNLVVNAVATVQNPSPKTPSGDDEQSSPQMKSPPSAVRRTSRRSGRPSTSNN